MKRLSLDIIRVSEVTWPEENNFWAGDYRMINTVEEGD